MKGIRISVNGSSGDKSGVNNTVIVVVDVVV